MPELKDMPRDEWEDADVDVSLIPFDPHLPRSIAQFYPRQQWDTYGYSDDSQEKKRLHDLENRAKVSVENQKSRAERLAKQKANVAWSSQTLKRDVRDKRKEKKAKKRQWVKSQQSQPSSPASAVPRKREREADDEDEDDEDDWAEISREERMAKKVKKGEISQLEFDAEFVP
jgi:ATP-dependent RNA helicase DDX55/SPB4